MSCYCPSGYTPTIDFDDCILTITASTSGGSFFYTGVAASNVAVYNKLGVIFYEDISTLSFPITNSGTTGSTTTQNGTPLTSTEFLLDSSGRILNMQAGGVGTGINNDGSYGPASIQNGLWGLGTTLTGRLNNAGIWPSTGNPALPLNEWIGFSYCLDIVSGGTYFVGLSADNDIRLKINNQTLVDCRISNYTATTMAMTGYSLVFTNHHVFPVTLTSGLNILELEGLNEGQFAAFVAEIYSGSVSTLSGYTSYSQLSADTIFSTLDFIGLDIPLSSSGATTNTGYTCPDGYSLYTCSGSPYCVYIDKVGLLKFCIINTGLGYDDDFYLSGLYNSEPYWTGSSTNRYIYFTNNGFWCLSDSLGGSCLLEGAYPCTSTPTPTPTVNCSVLDFSAVFDCVVTATPSVTPTISVTPTLTPTPSPSDPCGGRFLNATITAYTPTPSVTTTPTPTTTPIITRPCNVVGTVSFTTIDGELACPFSKQFEDCFTNEMFYTTDNIPLPSGGTISQNMVFKAYVNGVSRCVTFLGYNLLVIGVDSISLYDGPYTGTCSSCTPDISPTPTPTITPSVTPTLTATPTPSPATGYYVFRQCGNPTEYIIQTLAIPTFTPGDIFKTPAEDYCWEFMYYSSVYPTLPLGSTFTFISGSFFPSVGNTFYPTCVSCLASL